MKLSSKLILFIIAFCSLVAGSQTGPTREQVEELLKGRPGEVKWAETKQSNGVVEYSMTVTDCSGSQCQVVSNRVWRQTKAWIEVDGHYFLAETIDSIDNQGYPALPLKKSSPKQPEVQPKRLQFSAAVAQPSEDHFGFDPRTLQSLQLQTTPAIYDIAKEILPSLAVGVKNGIEDLARSLETSQRLHQAYLNGLQQSLQLVELNQQRSDRVREDELLNSAITATFLGQLQGIHSSGAIGEEGLQRARELAAFRHTHQDLATFRQFELTEDARAQLYEGFLKAVEAGQIGKAQRIAEVLLNQKDPQESSLAAQKLRAFMPNGIVNAKSFNLKPAALDDYKPQAELGTPAGQVVRKIANRAQSYWVETDGYSQSSEVNRGQYLAALSIMVQGDRAFANNDANLGYSLMDVAQALLDGSRGFARGLKDGTVESIKSIPSVVKGVGQLLKFAATDPKAAVDAAADIIVHSPEIAENLVLYTLGVAKDFVNAPAEKKGEMLGHFSSEVVIGVITNGAGSVAARAAKGLRIVESAAEAAKAMKTVFLKGELGEAFKRSGRELVEQIPQLNQQRLEGLKTILKVDPEGARMALGSLNILQTGEITSSAGAGEFIGKLLASKNPSLKSPATIENALMKYNKFEKVMGELPKSSFDEDVWRGIDKKITKNGIKVDATKEDVFELSPFNSASDHRFSIGGAEGENALYATLGTREQAERVILNETQKKSLDQLVLSSKRFQSDRVLDLRNTQELARLGILDDVSELVRTKSHLDGQVLGHLARKHNFEAIIFPSNFGNGINIVVFK